MLLQKMVMKSVQRMHDRLNRFLQGAMADTAGNIDIVAQKGNNQKNLTSSPWNNINPGQDVDIKIEWDLGLRLKHDHSTLNLSAVLESCKTSEGANLCVGRYELKDTFIQYECVSYTIDIVTFPSNMLIITGERASGGQIVWSGPWMWLQDTKIKATKYSSAFSVHSPEWNQIVNGSEIDVTITHQSLIKLSYNGRELPFIAPLESCIENGTLLCQRDQGGLSRYKTFHRHTGFTYTIDIIRGPSNQIVINGTIPPQIQTVWFGPCKVRGE
jgi:hypothetical protein